MDTVREYARPNRLNVLLTETDDHWSMQLPRLLEPQGVRALVAHNVDEALGILEKLPVHAVLVDVSLPIDPAPGSPGSQASAPTGGLKLLRVIQRLEPAPPAVVVRGRQWDTRLDDRLLAEALKLRAFTVLDQPVQLEQVLAVLQRLIQRHYGGQWPLKD